VGIREDRNKGINEMIKRDKKETIENERRGYGKTWKRNI
jgi:hypothetical protein